MAQEFPGRLFQDTDFEVEGFEKKKLEGLIGVLDREASERGPILVYIKVEDNPWQQFFLDAGIGFWENWGEIDIDDPSFLYIDYANEFKIGYKAIYAAYCQNSSIKIEFITNEKIILRYVDPTDMDSACEIVMENKIVV